VLEEGIDLVTDGEIGDQGEAGVALAGQEFAKFVEVLAGGDPLLFRHGLNRVSEDWR
jgi:hypothetical protein